MTNLFEQLFNSDKSKLKEIEKKIAPVEKLADTYRAMSDEELQNQTGILKTRLSNGETLDDILPEAFATAREAAYRVIGEYPYHVQLMGGYVMHNGDISEQLTGSGKTLTAVLPAYLNALAGKGVHIVTVNEYLAERDATRMGEIHRFLGLTVGFSKANMPPYQKKKAYDCDITYVSNSELGFDYLRDNMVTDRNHRVMRDLNYAIIDEIDSILIDEARTPLIISGKGEDTSAMCIRTDKAVKSLVKDKDYIINLRDNNCLLTEEGIHTVEKMFGIDNLYSINNTTLAHHIEQALKANYIMICNTDYIVDYDNQEILIVDPNTGRTMKGRQWSQGLHQAIEAKEGIHIKQESKTVASITYQNFFRLYNKLSGMSGTAKTEEEEFLKTYNMYVIPVPPNNPVIRVDYPDYIFGSEKAKYEAIVEEVQKLHAKGQPVLVGTVAVEKSEMLSDMLEAKHIPHNVLNAKNHALEAEIISHAGEKGAVTIATNMAGRGTDIKLGEGVKELGGLAVLGSERHKSRRIDNQLRGRSGRQGDPGFSRFYVSMKDELMVQYGSERLESYIAKLGDEKIESKVFTNAITDAQKRVEGIGFDARKTLLEYDDVLREQRETIYSARNRVLDNDNIHDYVLEIFEKVTDLTITNAMSESSSFGNSINGNSVIHAKTSLAIATALNKLPKEAVFSNDEFIGMQKDKAVFYASHTLFNLYSFMIRGLEELMHPVERRLVLKLIDMEWSDHIAIMDELRTGIGLRSYAQNNPLQEYVEEGYSLFKSMMHRIDERIVTCLLHLTIEYEDAASEEQITTMQNNIGTEPKKLESSAIA